MDTQPIDILCQKYIDQLNNKERIAYDIAREELGSSFNLLKSIGFKKWIESLEDYNYADIIQFI